jgi:tRNA threonylcarbamoyl adenosine modification protein (Sua5/YciO/YrdC/YwlC family)
MSAGLAQAGIPKAYEGALKYVSNPELISRTHFARHLVDSGVCSDMQQVFRRFLVKGKPGYVPHRWATLRDAVHWITGAGGMAVIAHPGRYRFTANEEYALFTEFKAHGGQAGGGRHRQPHDRRLRQVHRHGARARSLRVARRRLPQPRGKPRRSRQSSRAAAVADARVGAAGFPRAPSRPAGAWLSLGGRDRTAAGVAAGGGHGRRPRRRQSPAMSQYFEVHPDNPQPRLLKQAAQILHAGGIAAVPTDSSYALVCHLDDKAAVELLRRIRGIDDKHHLTLMCRDLSEVSSHARVDNRQYRLLKLGTPGPFTFILEATKEVPRRVSHASRRTIGLRIPDHRAAQDLLEMLGQPLLATTLIPPGDTHPLNDPREIRRRYEKVIQAIVDAGACPAEPTTVIDLTNDGTRLVRQGRGDLSLLGLARPED